MARNEKIFDEIEKINKKWLEENQIPYNKLIISADDKSKVCQKENIDIFIDDKYNQLSFSKTIRNSHMFNGFQS